MILMPLLVLGFYALQPDRSNISNALTDTPEIPSNMILQKLGAPIWLTGQVLIWGTIALTQAWVTNVHSFFATRFRLGFCEAGFIPVEGIFTLLVFFVFILLLPRSPMHTKPIHGCFDLFTSREREIMHDRIYQEDISKTEAHAKITIRGVIAALTDYRIWIHTILNLVSLAPKSGLQLYGPTIIRSLGFSKINSNLLN
ncbi:nicotinamide mononucleotide permease [Fusarium phyllophilum]|uniref:Nicotinamide mononucleotide permease n=1 Tax=Fusarium phyllophilum TaxID=47803 RepID=A0A8H5NA50_9HYPO|nr:nicotinamide mononucleotide permease [Fusarium phyllophilum]